MWRSLWWQKERAAPGSSVWGGLAHLAFSLFLFAYTMWQPCRSSASWGRNETLSFLSSFFSPYLLCIFPYLAPTQTFDCHSAFRLCEYIASSPWKFLPMVSGHPAPLPPNGPPTYLLDPPVPSVPLLGSPAASEKPLVQSEAIL